MTRYCLINSAVIFCHKPSHLTIAITARGKYNICTHGNLTRHSKFNACCRRITPCDSITLTECHRCWCKPNSSVATARTWLPTVACQLVEYGALLVTATDVPSTKNSTSTVPSVSMAPASMTTLSPIVTKNLSRFKLVTCGAWFSLTALSAPNKRHQHRMSPRG